MLPPFQDRLLPLSTGQPGLRTTIPVGIHAPPPDQIENQKSKIENPTLDFISSDETLDRYNEIICASGWKLDNYLRNPVYQNSHQYGDIIFTLGKALITEVRSVAGRQALFQRIEFAVDANPMARIAYKLCSGGFIRTNSVGFIPRRWEEGTPDSPYRRKFIEQELLEVSAVAIPANPNALALSLKSGAIEKADLQDTLDLLRQTLSHSQLSTLNPQPISPRCRRAIALAHELAQIMRHA